MADEQLNDLAEDIKTHGLRQKIMLYDGQVIDGRNRMLALERAKIPLGTRHFEKWAGEDPASLVVSLNARRRHLPVAARALIVAKIRQNLIPGSDSKTTMTLPEAASLAKVSAPTMERANAVVTKGIDEVEGAARSGTVSLKVAAKVARLPKAEQRRAAKDGPEGMKAAAASADKPDEAGREQAKALSWTVGMRDEAVRRLQACYEANKAKWNNPPPPSPRVMVDAMIWAMNEGAK